MFPERRRALLRRIVLTSIVALVLCVSGYRMVLLAAKSKRIMARGETRFFRWAHREQDIDTKFRDLRAALGGRRSIELVVHVAPFEETWWQIMCRYYLPGYRVVRIGTAVGNPPSPLTEAVVSYDGARFSIVELR
ncbi:MAG: hypothetical protein NDJ92_13015 [Thermoanaerobaculia bacterium]|nr:hypothetical protein [Thermoanaerobaculia bacterium]